MEHFGFGGRGGWGGGMRGPARGGAQVFEHQYQCFSTAMAGRSNMDEGDKILLPPSALEMLAQMNVEYPMLFELRNDAIEKKTHCGVMEFSAEEGRCYMPFWMMQNMLVRHHSEDYSNSAPPLIQILFPSSSLPTCLA